MEPVKPLDELLPPSRMDERRTAAGYVVEILRDAIRTGRLRDGVELNQVQLAEHFGLSRVPVREALRVLEAEGWIVARAHRRAVVQTLSVERIDQIFDMRALLEGYLAERAAQRCDAAGLARIAACCDAMDAAADHQAWLAANRDFHRAIHDAADAELAQEMVEQLTAQVERYLRLRGEDISREDEANAEHRELVRVLERRDASAARAIIETHVDHTRRRVLAAIGERDAAALEPLMENR